MSRAQPCYQLLTSVQLQEHPECLKSTARTSLFWRLQLSGVDPSLDCKGDSPITSAVRSISAVDLVAGQIQESAGSRRLQPDPVRPCFLAITSSDLAQLVSNFHTIHFSPSADIHQYGLLTKYQNLGYLPLTRNVKFRPVHLLVQWRLERRRL